MKTKFGVLVQRKKRSNNAVIGILTCETDGSFTVAAQYRNFTELPQITASAAYHGLCNWEPTS